MNESKLNVVWADRPNLDGIMAEFYIADENWFDMYIDEHGNTKLEIFPGGIKNPHVLDWASVNETISTIHDRLKIAFASSKK